MNEENKPSFVITDDLNNHLTNPLTTFGKVVVSDGNPDGVVAHFEPNGSLLVIHSSKCAVSDSDEGSLSIENRANTPRDLTDGKGSSSVGKFSIWSPKQRRAYHRIMSGYKMSQFCNDKLRFMTLTTSNQGRDNNLRKDFIVLVKRIRRRYRRFEYVRVRTSEGNGVLHVLYRGSYIPRAWLKSQWEDIHQSWNVDIRDTRRYHCSYVINQYLCGQSSFVRYSMTQNWVFKGFVAKWRAFCLWYPDKKIELWNNYLHKVSITVCQDTLDSFG